MPQFAKRFRFPRRMPSLVLVAIAALLIPACGGSGQGFRAASAPPLTVSGNTLPATETGQFVEVEIPLDGGCGGPYVVQVISGGENGGMPDGLGLDDSVVNGVPRHHIVGTILDLPGTYRFDVQISDTSCTPFLSTVVSYVWTITEGPVQIVAARPDIIPVAEYVLDPVTATTPYLDIDGLKTTVYNADTVVDLVAAGGRPPYVCAVIDDPLDPDDGNLPLGMTEIAGSCSWNGRPQQVLPGGVPLPHHRAGDGWWWQPGHAQVPVEDRHPPDRKGNLRHQ